MSDNEIPPAGASPEVDVDEFDADALADALADSQIENLGDYDADDVVDPTTGELTPRVSTASGSAKAQLDVVEQLTSAPLVLLARSHQMSNGLPALLAVARRATKGAIGLGLVVRAPNMSPSAAAAYLGSCPRNTVVLADPSLHQNPKSGSPTAAALSARASAWNPWFNSAPSHADALDVKWIRTVLDVQRSMQASVLLSATSWVDAVGASKQLADAMRWVVASRNEATDAPMFVNLTLDSSWLSNSALRALLLAELVESEEPLWYLRFYWPIVDPRYGQLANQRILEGYRELATVAALEGKRVILANSGLTGWIGTALGAAGFSTGPSWPEQAYAQQRQMASSPGRSRVPSRPRYFDTNLIHTIDHATQVAVSQLPSYAHCRCRYCANLPLSATIVSPWPKEEAGLHYLLSTAKLTYRLVANPRLEALREVRRARTFMSQLAGTASAPTGDNTPKHLVAWESLLT